MSEGAERVGFSQEMVNAFTTIAANGRGYIFTSKLKTNLKKIFHLQSVLQEKVILSVGGCVCVFVQAMSKMCKVETRVENQQDCIHPLCIPFAKIDRMRETLTEHKNNSENAVCSVD